MQEITPKYSEGNALFVVRVFACRRTNRERQHSWLLRFGGLREQLREIKIEELGFLELNFAHIG